MPASVSSLSARARTPAACAASSLPLLRDDCVAVLAALINAMVITWSACSTNTVGSEWQHVGRIRAEWRGQTDHMGETADRRHLPGRDASTAAQLPRSDGKEEPASPPASSTPW